MKNLRDAEISAALRPILILIVLTFPLVAFKIGADNNTSLGYIKLN